MMLDGGTEFTTRLNGRPVYPLRMKPSEYFRRQVRVSSFSYELPGRLINQTGDLYMCCSAYPPSEGTATPLADYVGKREASTPGRHTRPLRRQRRDAAQPSVTLQDQRADDRRQTNDVVPEDTAGQRPLLLDGVSLRTEAHRVAGRA